MSLKVLTNLFSDNYRLSFLVVVSCDILPIVAFKNMSEEEQRWTMLRWVVQDPHEADYAIDGSTIEACALKPAKQINDYIRDQHFDLARIREHLTNDAFASLEEIQKQRKRYRWVCGSCKKQIKKCERSVWCERCLIWSHFECSGLKINVKDKPWFCDTCKEDVKNRK